MPAKSPGSAQTITRVFAWEALDSRGTPTVACEVRLASGATGRAVAPSGASTGTHEAWERRDNDSRYAGLGVRDAVAGIHELVEPAVTGLDATDQRGLDDVLLELDGTALLTRLGGNAVLAVSLASALAAADHRDLPLWRSLGSSDEALLPLPMVNVISGGAHAAGLIDIQDILVVPVGATSFSQAIEWASRVRAATAVLARQRGLATALVADEGGLAFPLRRNEDALALVTDGIIRAGLQPGDDCALAIDIAANQLLHGDGYLLKTEGTALSSAQLITLIDSWTRTFPLVSVEDPLAEDDWEGWDKATLVLGARVQLLGDDHFATNALRLDRGITDGTANAVLIKPNQNGTVTGTNDVLTRAQAEGYATVVSARSGDTEDSWLADLAVGWQAGQIKVGSTMRSERLAKWNRLLQIEADPEIPTRFAGSAALAPVPGHR